MLYDITQIALERTISGTSARNEALASNLANANTPGYARVDVDFHGALAQAMGTSAPREALQSTGFAPVADAAGAMRADGSTVDVDAESAKLAANGLEHQTAVQVAAARLDILKSAMGVA
ncbi:MAG TPA: flagellar basal body rod protein FlgB [Solirubrobacteraceae bacterium]